MKQVLRYRALYRFFQVQLTRKLLRFTTLDLTYLYITFREETRTPLTKGAFVRFTPLSFPIFIYIPTLRFVLSVRSYLFTGNQEWLAACRIGSFVTDVTLKL